jgi:transposase
MRAYSVDLRERVVAAAVAGMPRAAIAATFQVSEPTVTRWVRRQRERGDLAPDVSPGRPPTITPDQFPVLQAQLEAHPDETIAWHAAQWNQQYGTTLSQWAVGRVIRRLGWTRKKRV